MKKYIALLLFLSNVALATSQTICLGTGSGGGGGSGTVTSVDMTVPSFLTVSGNPITTSGTLAVDLATEAANTVMAGPTTGAAAAPTFRALVTADFPNTAVTAGSYTNASLTVDAKGRLTAASSGSAKALADLSNLTNPTAVNQNLTMAGTNTLILPNNVALRALDNSVTARDIISIDAFNRTNIFGVGAGNILFNNNIIPAAADSVSMGVVGDFFQDIAANDILLGNSGAQDGQVDRSANDPAGNGAVSGVTFHTVVNNKNLYLFTMSSTLSKPVWIESGNASAGDSGDIHLQTGTATGNRGNILIDAPVLMLPTTVTAGGTTGDRTINKMSGTVNFAASASAITVTDSVVSTSSLVFATARTNDATCSVKNVVPGSGSFVITMSATCTAETSVGFLVVNQ